MIRTTILAALGLKLAAIGGAGLLILIALLIIGTGTAVVLTLAADAVQHHRRLNPRRGHWVWTSARLAPSD